MQGTGNGSADRGLRSGRCPRFVMGSGRGTHAMAQDTPPHPSPIDIDAALANPSAFFAQPRDVLAHAGLSRELQLKLLRQWEQDARELADAESEGMGGGEESMLGRVAQALRALDRR